MRGRLPEPASSPGLTLAGILTLAAVAGCTTGAEPEDTGPLRPFFDTGVVDVGPGDAPLDAEGERCDVVGMGATIGVACADDESCDDGCFCNGVELCTDGECALGREPCPDDGVECTMDACVEADDRCSYVADDEACEDDDACNGAEICDPRLGCRPGSPLYCNDEDSCTVDSCDVELGCVFTPRDLDGDGHRDGRCGGDDCDDDPRYGRDIYPGATEDCRNRRDDDCDGLRDFADESCLPTNDTCLTAEVLPGPGIYPGATTRLRSDYPLSCRETGSDAVFRFNVPSMSDVQVSLMGGGSSAIALRPFAMCERGPDDKCTSAGAFLRRRSVPPGDYALIIKTAVDAPFDLNLMLLPPTTPPPVDVCDAMTEDVSAGGTFTGFFDDTSDQYTLSCHDPRASRFPEAAYRFTIDSPRDVALRATQGTSGYASTYVSLLTDCADPATTRQCINGPNRSGGGETSVLHRGLPAGTYFVLIESSSEMAASFSLDVTITEPRAPNLGDACSTAIDITSASANLDLALLQPDGGTACQTYSTYRDASFYFDLTETRDVTLTTTSPGYHSVAIASACGFVGTELRCRSSNFGQPLVNTFRSLPAGRYHVAVSTSSTSGSVSASIATSPPTTVPPNDRCAGAIEVGAGYSSVDTTQDFEDDVRGCGGTVARPDAIYRLTLASRRRVLVSAERISGSGNIYLTLRDVCGAGTDISCDDGPTAILAETLDAGEYFIFVESQSFIAAGDFRLDVATLPP